MRLSHYIQEFIHPESSLKAIKKAIEENQCTVNGKIERFHSYQVKPGDVVQCKLSLSKPFTYLFQDENLAIVDKPPFVVCNADKGLLGWHLAHRLDKETSGCLLLAKNQSILSDLEELFRQRAIQKTYIAVVEKTPKESSGVITDPIQGKKAVTSFKLKQSGLKYHLVECYPETGRTHQIRIHLSHHGMPIVGDVKYGSKFASWNRVLLHASRLEFTHPLTSQKIDVKAPLPKEFYEALNR